jgi:predicted nucleic acid-binding Zn ribbon protein
MAQRAMPIGEILEKVLKKLGLERRAREARIAQEWGRIVGERIAMHSKPVALRGKTLIVHVDSSVWLSELSQFFKDKILEQVRGELGEKRIGDIRFRIGDV